MHEWQQSIRQRVWPRILFIDQDYLVAPQVRSAMHQLGIEYKTVSFRQDKEFLHDFFDIIKAFQPRFILTINHAGLDAEGQVLHLLKRAGIPLASWFVDRHEMFLRNRVGKDALLAVFSWDPDAVTPMARLGVGHAAYLPLAADIDHFFAKPSSAVLRDMAFVGASWMNKVADVRRAGSFPPFLLEHYEALAQEWAEKPEEPVFQVLRRSGEAYSAWKVLPEEKRLMFIRLIQLQATYKSRVQVVAGLSSFCPVVVGDVHWKDSLEALGCSFSWQPRISYQAALPDFYRQTSVNLNICSLQSRNAQNQRVFDVPAGQNFVLTEAGQSLEMLFEPGVEAATYSSPQELEEAVGRWLGDAAGRKQIAEAGYRRIMAQHTYMHRVNELVSAMERVF